MGVVSSKRRRQPEPVKPLSTRERRRMPDINVLTGEPVPFTARWQSAEFTGTFNLGVLDGHWMAGLQRADTSGEVSSIFQKVEELVATWDVQKGGQDVIPEVIPEAPDARPDELETSDLEEVENYYRWDTGKEAWVEKVIGIQAVPFPLIMAIIRGCQRTASEEEQTEKNALRNSSSRRR